MNPVFFSVILPTHNRRVLLQRAVDSVLQQVYDKWELIVVDDGSTDDTVSYLRSVQDERIKVISIEHNERSIARNEGIEASRGDYICFLDDDDYYLPDYLSQFASYYTNSENKDKILRTGFLTKNKNQQTKSSLYDVSKGIHPVLFFSHEMCGIWSLCIPRSYLSENRFPESYPHWQDSHLLLRLFSMYDMHQLNGWSYVYVQHDRMGSKELFRNREIVERTDLQIEAINDLFQNHQDTVGNYLKPKDQKRLISEKRIRAAALLNGERQFRSAWQEMMKADVSLDLWPSYGRIFLTLLISSGLRLFEIIKSAIVFRYHRVMAKGEGVCCPCCGHSYKYFSSYGIASRDNARCWNCNSLERHRLLHLYIENETDLFQLKSKKSLLHFGPSEVMYDRFARLESIDYTAVDLNPDDYPMKLEKMDMTSIDRPAESFDFVMAIHIMEHIKDDGSAIKELHRVLKPEGIAILMIPIDIHKEDTVESDISLSGDENELLYGQTDHVRLYGRDFSDRLSAHGFHVDTINYACEVTEEEILQFAIFREEIIFVCRKI